MNIDDAANEYAQYESTVVLGDLEGECLSKARLYRAFLRGYEICELEMEAKLALAKEALEFYSHPSRASSIDGETELHWESDATWFEAQHKPFGTKAREVLEKLKLG